MMKPDQSPNSTDATVFIDVTDTLVRGLGTGIQRVVRKIAQNTLDFPDVVLVFASGPDFYRLNEDALIALLGSRHSGELGNLPPSAGRVLKDAIKSFVTRFPAIQVKIQRHTVGKWFRAETVKWQSGAAIQFKRGDKLVLLDTFWNGSDVLPAAASARSCGADIILVVHDTIPITHPDQVPADVAAAFPYEMKKAFALSSGILATSLTGLETIRQQMALWRISCAADYFYLGADLPTGFNNVPHGKNLGKDPDFLIVGTIEPRKGHAIILDAFEHLWKAGIKANLTFAGKIGWIEKKLLDRLTRLSASHEFFCLKTSVSDEMLESLYSEADAVLVASSIEGFGLPLVEALNRGVPVIASDIPIFREIAADHGIYFKSGDSADLFRTLNDFILERGSASTTTPFCWPDWHAASRAFHDAVIRVGTASAR